MSWSRKGALLGAILGLLVIVVIGYIRGGATVTLWHLVLGPIIGAMSGWAVGKIVSK